jgi:hypothetical protein
MTTAVSSLCRKNPHAPCEEQMPYWVEFQLVDELGDAVANMPWVAESSHPVSGPVDNFTHSGQSDANGLIRIDMPHGLELKLTLDGNQLATEMETRPLRVGRDPIKYSTVRPKTEENGYVWHYMVIGELCRTLPSIKLRDGEVWPPFHFPADKIMKGLTVRSNQLEKRHVIEICPFRSWELVLHHQSDYSFANALNLGGGACLAYADDNVFDETSITRFFINQCQDLSKTPMFHKGASTYNALVSDIPYSDRYNPPVFMDTSKNTAKSSPNSDKPNSKKPADNSDGDTQLYYVYNADKVIISWRGTAGLYDIGTDLAFSPIDTEVCNGEKMECKELLPIGKVHNGFWSGYSRVSKKYEKEMSDLLRLAGALDLYICGHSLGGALALIQAAALKDAKPILYTYGMPRTFTKDAIQQLSSITHYRHVNDNDPVPAVPPEANVDNELYRLWGPVGALLGMTWSVGELMAYQLKPWGDCFWHHGKIVAFFTATQFREWKECKVSFPEQAGCITLSGPMAIKAKLYLVPSLADSESNSAGEKQHEYKESLTTNDLHKYFSEEQNPSRLADLTFSEHFMTSYMPYINNKMLGLIDEKGFSKVKHFTEHAENIEKFEEQISEEKQYIPKTELQRNELFLSLEKKLDIALNTTIYMKNGNSALERFALYGEEDMENA